jgi:hypothetical protein
MIKYGLCICLVLSFLLASCAPGTNGLATRGSVESLPREIKEGSEVVINHGQTVYVFFEDIFQDAKGGYIKVCQGVAVGSSRDKTDQVSLKYSNETVRLVLRSYTARVYENLGVFLCESRIVLAVSVQDSVKPGIYAVEAILEIEDGENKGELEISFNVRVAELHHKSFENY